MGNPELANQLEKEAILELIKQAREKIGLGDDNWERKVERKPYFEVLRDKHVLMVDDYVGNLNMYIDHLMVATQGKAEFLLYDIKEETQAELVERILKINPDIILMDSRLGEKRVEDESGYHYEYTTGPGVTKSLRGSDFKNVIIKFSSEGHDSSEADEYGADGSVAKNESASYDLERICELVNKIELSKT